MIAEAAHAPDHESEDLRIIVRYALVGSGTFYLLRPDRNKLRGKPGRDPRCRFKHERRHIARPRSHQREPDC
jgi:hypothetical protein